MDVGNLKTWNSLSDASDIQQGSNDEKYIAYELDITLNNLTDEFMPAKRISSKGLEQA